MDARLHKAYQDLADHHWWFVVRRKIVFDLARKFIRTPAHQAILDFGCNHGYMVGLLQKAGYEAYGVDVSADAIEFGTFRGIRNLALYSPAVFNIEKDIFPEKKFTMIMALDVVEHIKDDGEAFGIMKRKLASGGKIVIMVPAYMWMWGVQDKIAHHERRYTAKTLRAAAEGAGLKTEYVSYFNTLLFPPIAIVRLLAKIIPVRRTSDFDGSMSWFNGLFRFIFGLERHLLRFVKFPFGVSILAVFTAE